MNAISWSMEDPRRDVTGMVDNIPQLRHANSSSREQESSQVPTHSFDGKQGRVSAGVVYRGLSKAVHVWARFKKDRIAAPVARSSKSTSNPKTSGDSLPARCSTHNAKPRHPPTSHLRPHLARPKDTIPDPTTRHAVAETRVKPTRSLLQHEHEALQDDASCRGLRGQNGADEVRASKLNDTQRQGQPAQALRFEPELDSKFKSHSRTSTSRDCRALTASRVSGKSRHFEVTYRTSDSKAALERNVVDRGIGSDAGCRVLRPTTRAARTHSGLSRLIATPDLGQLSKSRIQENGKASVMLVVELSG
ncbi:hypothetical protein D9611_014770 [Ephemerocybe angulata]|uniref:Uncharacterized protein n=1 Tax=Ephemerocybe angulata TaxID=980116 RepID=A0A8H5BS35_9AGAR|nr:hypothetical protein D9611_014770 [Tulosesus angulatus]